MKEGWINETPIEIRPKETILQAALRSGVDFPFSCRVGGCGACKCRVVEGEVKELTETAYLLTREEIANGTVLACQSVPVTDAVRIEVAARASGHRTGRIVERERLTPDIVRLRIALDEPLDHVAGQFVNVGLASEPGVRRSYSFASPPSDGRDRIELFVRRVPGGRMSSALCDAAPVGAPLVLDGPHGDVRLRPGVAPLLLVAGGSGLAPILALAREAAAAGERRDAVLLFGARRREDLYEEEAIAALARRWPGRLTFVPVLSEEPSGSAWDGERGLVTEALARHAVPAAHAYVCGPPAMVDAAAAVLSACGVLPANVAVDRFVTAEPEVPLATAFDYLKFFTFHGIGFLALVSLLAGGRAVTAGLFAIVATYVLGDALAGDDVSRPRFAHPRILTFQLWLALPLLVLLVFAAVWSVSPGDPLAFGAVLTRLTGLPFLAWRAATTPGQHVAGWILTGLMIGMVGTIPAHELTHRTWDRVSMLIGRWLLAFSFDASFAIEHVHGHHRYVSTSHDPATAPRGRSVFAHVAISTIRGNVSAWRIEAERLRRRGYSVVSWRNAVLRGYAMSGVLVLAACLLGGAAGAGYFVACGLLGKALLEVVNYMEHYGLTRDPATPVSPRHSWNTNRRVSSWALFNLSRHSHHHAQGEVPYHELAPLPDAPMMLGGYLSTMLLTLVPPLWFRLMAPKLAAWDREHATATERRLASPAGSHRTVEPRSAMRISSSAPVGAPRSDPRG